MSDIGSWEERRAWDWYAAAFAGWSGDAVEAAAHADMMLTERRKRFDRQLERVPDDDDPTRIVQLTKSGEYP